MIEAVRDCLKRALSLDEASAASVSESTTAADLPAWTSVTHLSLVLELEKTFGVQFANDEIVSLGSVSAIIASLQKKDGLNPESTGSRKQAGDG